MTRIVLLERLRDFTNEAVKDLLMPTKPQKGDTEAGQRTADVYLMRLPDSSYATKKAPYILHQFVTGKDEQKPGTRPQSTAVVRSVFCVYSGDEQEGGLLLLNLMERLRVSLLEKQVVGKQFTLMLGEGLEALAYPDSTAPFYLGEMISTWKLPPIEREVYGYGRK